jgi:signal transduction histidine kinase
VRAGALTLSVLLLVPMVWRRRFPLAIFAFVAVVAFAQWVANERSWADGALLLGLYAIATRRSIRAGIFAASVLEVGVVLAAIRWPQRGGGLAAFVFLSGLVAAALLLGITVRTRRDRFASVTDRAERLEREKGQQALIVAAAERTRIAREMHDIVAHSLSVMVTLAEGASMKVHVAPDRAETAMRDVSTTGRQALQEMRRLLGVLRTDEQDSALQPQPGVSDIDELVEQVRTTGLMVELTVSGTPVGLSPGPSLTIFRIVQEALTNILKHASNPTRVIVSLRFCPTVVVADVRDDGSSARSINAGTKDVEAPEYGLTGMRERAAVYGGSVTAGPYESGGWRVRASLPIGDGGEVKGS